VYNFLKKNIKSILPNSFVFKNELFLRYFYGILYIGKKHHCNICKHNLRSFIDSKKQICPFCGSLPRTRRLWQFINNDNCLNGNVLHFSPSRSLYRKLKKQGEIDYYSSDYEDEFLSDYKFDITQIKQPDEKFEFIICYHILEHIIDDMKAISELYRVLNEKGTIYLQTPFKDGDIYEDSSITSPERRKEHFGQDDHVRIYSVKGLKERLEQMGFNVLVKDFISSDDDLYFGFKSPETILVLTK
jgi:SAM-dependent methyltransferase